jgi:bifunctional DNA-binding transcriptional regulator/antitoxin component of YhaV-PrlF toxin-antitoxin module
MGAANKAKSQTTLTVTAKGQVTLRKDVLQHLGVQPGSKIIIEKLPAGRISVRAEEQNGDISRVFGMLHQENGPHLTIAEINQVIAGSWAGER